jgi:hypothetical protein
LRLSVAANPNTPAEALLYLLAQHKDCAVRQTSSGIQAHNDNAIHLTPNGDCAVRQAIARHPNTPAEALSFLAREDDAGVRWWVARNPGISRKLLAVLAEDMNLTVQRGALERLRRLRTATLSDS